MRLLVTKIVLIKTSASTLLSSSSHMTLYDKYISFRYFSVIIKKLFNELSNALPVNTVEKMQWSKKTKTKKKKINK